MGRGIQTRLHLGPGHHGPVTGTILVVSFAVRSRVWCASSIPPIEFDSGTPSPNPWAAVGIVQHRQLADLHIPGQQKVGLREVRVTFPGRSAAVGLICAKATRMDSLIVVV